MRNKKYSDNKQLTLTHNTSRYLWVSFVHFTTKVTPHCGQVSKTIG